MMLMIIMANASRKKQSTTLSLIGVGMPSGPVALDKFGLRDFCLDRRTDLVLGDEVGNETTQDLAENVGYGS